MGKKIRIALIGCGGVGRVLAKAMSDSAHGQLVKVYDIEKKKKHALAREFGLVAVTQLEKIVNCSNIDAVIVASPPYTHHDLIMELATAGKHVFVEKPMALSIDACSSMHAAMESSGKKMMVGHVLRYYEPFNTIIDLTKKQVFGKLLHVDIKRIEGDHFIKGSSWKGKKALSGGYLFELGTHEIDFMRCLLGEPIGVSSSITKVLPSEHEIEDRVAFNLQFDGGVQANYLGGTGFQKPEYSFSLYYQKASMRSSNFFDPSKFILDTNENIDISSILYKVNRPVNPFLNELEDWLLSIQNDTEVPVSGIDAGESVRTIEMIYEKAQFYNQRELVNYN